MPRVGDLVSLNVDKVIKNGAFLSSKKDKNDYFLHRKEAGDKWVEVGETIQGRIVGTKRHRGKLSYQVSLRMVDEEEYRREQLNKKIEVFMKRSAEKHSQIRKNKERKHNNGKRKTNKKAKK